MRLFSYDYLVFPLRLRTLTPSGSPLSKDTTALLRTKTVFGVKVGKRRTWKLIEGFKDLALLPPFLEKGDRISHFKTISPPVVDVPYDVYSANFEE